MNVRSISSVITRNLCTNNLRRLSITAKHGGGGGGDDEWNDTWETAWLPEDLSAKNRAPWESDVNFSLSDNTNSNENVSNNTSISSILSSEVDAETKAFVEDMTDNWDQRRGNPKLQNQKKELANTDGLYSLENVKKDYRLKKQRIHAGLWSKEIEKQEEAKLGDSILGGGGGDDIEKLLDSCAEIFDSGNNNLNNSKVGSSSEYKNKPDGWETNSKAQDGNLWEMSQREEDILLQEFERRIAFSKFQIASFIKTHIFSRRRPIDGWKYMIEELGPNARKGKGSVSRVPSLSDPATQPFREEKAPIPSALPSHRGRDSTGEIVYAQTKMFPGVLNPSRAEAIAVKEALNWCDREQGENVIIESDCLVIVQAIRSAAPIRSDFGLVIEECRKYLRRLNNIKLYFIKRSANMVAHTLARVSYLYSERSFDRNTIPIEVKNILDMDLI